MTCVLQDFRKDKCSGCNAFCPHKVAMEGLTGNSGILEKANIPLKYRGVTLETSPVRADKEGLYSFMDNYAETMKDYIKNGGEPPRSLYLYSTTPGTGKTTTAVALLTYYLSYHYLFEMSKGNHPRDDVAYFLDVNELQTIYNNFNRPRVPDNIAEPSAALYYKRIEKAKKAELVVMDDIGVRSTTDGFTGDLHTVINYRVANDMPTVFTSNIKMEELEDLFTERFYDRVRAKTIDVVFTGKSFRGLRK